MNAFECLEAYRKAAGFDGWVERLPKQPIYTPKLELGENVDTTIMRPAWRDGDGWFVLPDGWTWSEYLARPAFSRDGVYIRGIGDHWYLEYGGTSRTFPTAPEAFRAAERYLKGGK